MNKSDEKQGGGQPSQFRELSSLLIERSRSLRTEMTPAEKALWYRLRQRQINGLKFRRQHPIGPYIADFACIECKLVIELDGGEHAKREEYDMRRDNLLRKKGYRVLRFWNTDVMENLESVFDRIVDAVRDPHLTSPFQGEESKGGASSAPPPGRGRMGGGRGPQLPSSREEKDPHLTSPFQGEE